MKVQGKVGSIVSSLFAASPAAVPVRERKLMRSLTRRVMAFVAIGAVVGFAVSYGGVIAARSSGTWFARTSTGRGAVSAPYDPYALIGELAAHKTDIVLADIRPAEAFAAGRIRGAVSIPVPLGGEFAADDKRILPAFRQLAGKRIVIYGVSAASPLPASLAAYLTSKGIAARYLSIGWNEFAHFKTLWVPEHAWNTVDPKAFAEFPAK